jgi:modulator of FtsH protease
MEDAQFITERQGAVVSTNKVLRNTYLLLSMTLLFSAAMAGVAMAIEAPYMGWLPLIFAFALLFAISKMKNSAWGILLVFAFTGILGFSLVVIGAIVLSLVGGMFGFHISGLQLAISSAIVMLMSGLILYDTSKIIHGGETNYIMATVGLYLNIYNLFVSLLHLVGFFGGDD